MHCSLYADVPAVRQPSACVLGQLNVVTLGAINGENLAALHSFADLRPSPTDGDDT